MAEMSKDQIEMLNNPCTIKEAVQIARAVAEDVVTDYLQRVSQVQMAISLQVETLKDMLFSNDILSEERFKEVYLLKASQAEEMRRQMMEETADEDSSMDMESGEVEVEITQRGEA